MPPKYSCQKNYLTSQFFSYKRLCEKRYGLYGYFKCHNRIEEEFQKSRRSRPLTNLISHYTIFKLITKKKKKMDMNYFFFVAVTVK
jgi:hypothetical protein